MEIINTAFVKVALLFDSNKFALKENKTQMVMLSRNKITLKNELMLRN